MKLEVLQAEMISAMKSKNKFRKEVISTLVSAVKKAGIDKGCRDNIPEELVNTALLKEQKTMQEMIDTCPVSRIETLTEYKNKMKIINEFAPKLINNPEEIKEKIMTILADSDLAAEKANKGAIMKVVMPAMKGKADMGIVNKVLGEILN